MNKGWSLESELCDLAKCTGVSEALFCLKLIGRFDEKYELINGQSWKRMGAETFSYCFSIIGEDTKSRRDYIIKACVPFSPATALDQIIENWVSRRRLLYINGINIPKLITYGKGILIEEFIHFHVKERIIENLKPNTNIIIELVKFAAVLSKLGFSPINAFKDLRSHGDDVVVIDFGEDLGGPGVYMENKTRIFDQLTDALKEWNLYLSHGQADVLYTSFLVAAK